VDRFESKLEEKSIAADRAAILADAIVGRDELQMFQMRLGDQQAVEGGAL